MTRRTFIKSLSALAAVPAALMGRKRAVETFSTSIEYKCNGRAIVVDPRMTTITDLKVENGKVLYWTGSTGLWSCETSWSKTPQHVTTT